MTKTMDFNESEEKSELTTPSSSGCIKLVAHIKIRWIYEENKYVLHCLYWTSSTFSDIWTWLQYVQFYVMSALFLQYWEFLEKKYAFIFTNTFEFICVTKSIWIWIDCIIVYPPPCTEHTHSSRMKITKMQSA